jgi:hypothetical protein
MGLKLNIRRLKMPRKKAATKKTTTTKRTRKKTVKAKTVKAKAVKAKAVNASETSELREFVDGKMKVTRTIERLVSVERLNIRKADRTQMYDRMLSNMQTRIDVLTAEIAAEEDVDIKARKQERLDRVTARLATVSAEKTEAIDRIQGWIDSANASA